jgi:ABC-2 type transport system permease protein
MATIFRYALTRFGGQILGWGLALFLLGWPVLSTYDVIQQEQERIKEIAKNFRFFFSGLNVDLSNLASPSEYLTMRLFSLMPLILGVFAVLTGSGLLASEEESGTLDLVLAHPVSRTGLFLGRWLAFVAALLLVLSISWLGNLLWMSGTRLKNEVGGGQLVLPYLSLLAVLLFFGTLALLLSLLLPSRRLAATTAGMVLVLSYFVTMMARLDPSLHAVARLSPLDYYQSGKAILGLNGTWFGSLLAVAGLFTVLAWWRFERKDIRVVGEGVWRWPLWRRKLAG